MREELKVWMLTVTIVVVVFAINLSLQVTTAKAQGLVKNFINERGEVIQTTYVNTRDQMRMCTHNPKLPSCPISKVLPKPKSSPNDQ